MRTLRIATGTSPGCRICVDCRDNLKRALRADYDESLWEHLSGTTSPPFEAGGQRQIGVKVIDERGNELLVVRGLD